MAQKKNKEDLERRDDRVSVVGTNGDESPRRESAVEVDEEEEDFEASVEPDYRNQQLDETMDLDPRSVPTQHTDHPADISPRTIRDEAEIGLSLKTDKELMADYENRAAEDRREKKTG
jgi:hypothetical protein